MILAGPLPHHPVRSASYPVLVHLPTASLHASSRRSVALPPLRFASLAVACLREDLHLQVSSHVGQTGSAHAGTGDAVFGVVAAVAGRAAVVEVMGDVDAATAGHDQGRGAAAGAADAGGAAEATAATHAAVARVARDIDARAAAGEQATGALADAAGAGAAGGAVVSAHAAVGLVARDIDARAAAHDLSGRAGADAGFAGRARGAAVAAGAAVQRVRRKNRGAAAPPQSVVPLRQLQAPLVQTAPGLQASP